MNLETRQSEIVWLFQTVKRQAQSVAGFWYFLNGTILELIRIYFAEINDRPNGFYSGSLLWKTWYYYFLGSPSVDTGLRIYINRVEEQNNDYHCGQAGRMKCTDMFYRFNHSISREVE